MTTLPVLATPTLQCLACGSAMRFTGGTPLPTETSATIYCDSCAVTAEWPLTIVQATIVTTAP